MPEFNALNRTAGGEFALERLERMERHCLKVSRLEGWEGCVWRSQRRKTGVLWSPYLTMTLATCSHTHTHPHTHPLARYHGQVLKWELYHQTTSDFLDVYLRFCLFKTDTRGGRIIPSLTDCYQYLVRYVTFHPSLSFRGRPVFGRLDRG